VTIKDIDIIVQRDSREFVRVLSSPMEKNSSRRKLPWKISTISRIPESYNFLYITQKEPGHML